MGVFGLKEHDCAMLVNDIIERELCGLGFDIHRINADRAISYVKFWQTWRRTLKWKTARINRIDEIDLVIETHFNACPSHNGQGHEVLCVSRRGQWFAQIVDRCFDKMLPNGPQDRDVKHRDSLWFLNETDYPAIILEPCFIDNREDAGMLCDERGRMDIAKAVVQAMVIAKREMG